ncbi:Mov34/MPN/PAD-1 family protein [Dyella sp.]|uniref:Mov34/MPN/PAD-1 family protein n=1 Tax=Dyella sp. TaxID=1869338 RepID=UPI002B47B16A|nr:Mov34/MPN/PAD-1 family protein [Dyella sp.]HKT29156.1 Mov34/MPN/PAD-1 family protein [Dyella sp.]
MTTPALRFRIPGHDFVLELAPHVLVHLEAHKQLKWTSREAGGQLFADLNDPTVIRVIDVTGPRPTDRRSVFGYEPDRDAERFEISERYAQDLHFIGDWHTHRQRIPIPSRRDEWSMRDMVRQSAHSLLGFFMVIVGQTDFPWGLHVSLHRKDGADRLIAIQLDESTQSSRGH